MIRIERVHRVSGLRAGRENDVGGLDPSRLSSRLSVAAAAPPLFLMVFGLPTMAVNPETELQCGDADRKGLIPRDLVRLVTAPSSG